MAVTAPSHQQKKAPAIKRLTTFGQRFPLFIAAVMVVFIIVGSLAVSVMAIKERLKTASATRQILDLVDLTQRIANTEHTFGTKDNEDILQRLSHMEQLQVSGDNGHGFKTMRNPWDGEVIAYTENDNRFRIETPVPSHICARIIDVLNTNIKSLGLREIDAKGDSPIWLQLYNTNKDHASLNTNLVNVGCQAGKNIILAFTFTLR